MTRDAERWRWRGARKLAWLVVAYAVALWWIHHLVRQPINLDYFRTYVSLRCSDAEAARFPEPRSRDDLAGLAGALERCRAIGVTVDGVWGGIGGKPAVRLKVVRGGSSDVELRYYSVEVDPVLGIASIRYELDPALYHLNP